MSDGAEGSHGRLIESDMRNASAEGPTRALVIFRARKRKAQRKLLGRLHTYCSDGELSTIVLPILPQTPASWLVSIAHCRHESMTLQLRQTRFASSIWINATSVADGKKSSDPRHGRQPRGASPCGAPPSCRALSDADLCLAP